MRLQHIISSSLLVLVLLGTLVAGNKEILQLEDHEKVRTKRNIVCALGLQGLIRSIFMTALQSIHKYDPMDVGGTEGGHLHSGVFTGLTTLTNATDLNVTCDGSKVIFSTTLSLKNAQIRYKWNRRLLLRFSGDIWTSVKTIHFAFEVVWDFNGLGKGTAFDITRAEVTKIEGFRFGFTGLGPLNPIVAVVMNVLSRIWSRKISSIIANLINEALRSQLEGASLPI